MIDALHQRHPCQEAEDEADDGCSLVHHGRNLVEKLRLRSSCAEVCRKSARVSSTQRPGAFDENTLRRRAEDRGSASLKKAEKTLVARTARRDAQGEAGDLGGKRCTDQGSIERDRQGVASDDPDRARRLDDDGVARATARGGPGRPDRRGAAGRRRFSRRGWGAPGTGQCRRAARRTWVRRRMADRAPRRPPRGRRPTQPSERRG